MGFTPEVAIGLVGYFKGSWRFVRQVADRKTGKDALVDGVVHFHGEGPYLTYAETGNMTYGAFQGQVTQKYIYHFSSPFKADVLFSDQRFFHPLNLKSGVDKVEHWCDPDHYKGRYWLRDQGSWSLEWEISGLRKNSFISTVYHRELS